MTSEVRLPAVPHSADPAMNSARQNMYTRFCPKSRARNAVSGMTSTRAIA
jgi:hypothetical protein